jgi:hypothetical protein
VWLFVQGDIKVVSWRVRVAPRDGRLGCPGSLGCSGRTYPVKGAAGE